MSLRISWICAGSLAPPSPILAPLGMSGCFSPQAPAGSFLAMWRAEGPARRRFGHTLALGEGRLGVKSCMSSEPRIIRGSSGQG
eukprot:1200220-Pyramimonas_sp.AAC.1